MANLTTGARRAAATVLQTVIPNPIAALAPTLAVTATALAVLPLIAAEQFSGERRTSESNGNAAGGDPERPEAETASGNEAANDAPADAPGEPIAIDSRRENRRDDVDREKIREERAERRSEQRAAREERPRRRHGDNQAETEAVGVPADARSAGPDAPATQTTTAEVATDQPAAVVDGNAASSGTSAQATEAMPSTEPRPAPEQETVAAETEQPTTLQRVLTEQRVLVAPLVDTAIQTPRAVERLRVQKEQAETAILNSPDVIAVVAPLVRHVNTITEHLNEAQRTIGRLTAERDALRQRLIEQTGGFAVQVDTNASGVDQRQQLMLLDQQVEPDTGEVDRRQQRLLRIEARQDVQAADGDEVDEPGRVKRYFQQAGFIIPEDASEEEFKQAARKRQIIAVVLIAAIGLGMWIAQRSGNDVGTISRESLAEIAFIGFFVQIFLALWILFRIVRVGGRGARWLFPQPKTRRRRR